MHNIKIGMKAPEVIQEIVRANQKINFVNLAVYTPAKCFMPETASHLARHNPPLILIEVGREAVIERNLDNYKRFSCEPDLVACCSKLHRKVGEQIQFFHLPLMDFSCKPSAKNLKRVC